MSALLMSRDNHENRPYQDTETLAIAAQVSCFGQGLYYLACHCVHAS